MESILFTVKSFIESVNELKSNWKKIKLKHNAPIVTFIEDDNNRIELVIK